MSLRLIMIACLVARSCSSVAWGAGPVGRGLLFVGNVGTHVFGLRASEHHSRSPAPPQEHVVGAKSWRGRGDQQSRPISRGRIDADVQRRGGSLKAATTTSIPGQERKEGGATGAGTVFKREQRKWWQDPDFPQNGASAEEVWSGAGAEPGKPRVSVVSYNILAQSLVKLQNYGVDGSVLRWRYRRERIIAELKGWNSDIILLQEVDKHHYEEDLLPALESAGYTGRFKKRNTPTKVDGCAMFWKASKLTLDKYEAVNLDKGGRYNVAQVATMTHKEGGGGLCVCNTHLLFNPQRGDIKLAQVAQLLNAVRKASSSPKLASTGAGGGGGGGGKRGEAQCAILMGGDFNFLPFSPLYRLVTSGVIVEDVKLRELSGQNRWKAALRGARQLKGVSVGAHGGRGGLCDPGVAAAGEGNGRARGKHEPGATLGLKDVFGMAKSAILEGNSGTKFSSWWRRGGEHWLSKIGGGLMRVGVDGKSITQPLSMSSSYATRGPEDDGRVYEPLLTSCHEGGLASTVDYVFHSGRGLKRVGLWELLDPSTMLPLGSIAGVPGGCELGDGVCGLPNRDWGSDHLSLAVLFELSADE